MEQLIHADKNRAEIGVVTDYTRFDAQLHHNCALADNTFALQMTLGAWRASKIMRGDCLYIDGTEFGGVVSSVAKDTTTDAVTVKGAVWRALLAARIIQPPSGAAYRVYSGVDANAMIADVVDGEFGGLFTVPDGTIKTLSAQFRYPTCLAGLSKALTENGLTLSCIYDAQQQRVVAQARTIVDYSDYSDISSDLGIGMKFTSGRVDDFNHVVALGSGELEARMIRELWMLDGVVYQSRPAALAPADVRSFTFDYPNAESEEELIASATDALKEYAATASASIDLSQLQLSLQLDDVITTIDRDLDIAAKKSVAQRILTMTRDGMTIQTEVD